MLPRKTSRKKCRFRERPSALSARPFPQELSRRCASIAVAPHQAFTRDGHSDACIESLVANGAVFPNQWPPLDRPSNPVVRPSRQPLPLGQSRGFRSGNRDLKNRKPRTPEGHFCGGAQGGKLQNQGPGATAPERTIVAAVQGPTSVSIFLGPLLAKLSAARNMNPKRI